MKKILLAVSIFGYLLSNAQQKIYLYPQRPMKKFQPYQPWNKKLPNDLEQKRVDSIRELFKTRSFAQPKLLYTLKDNTKVFSLPQDNMICLVPDLKQFNMPNAANPQSYFELKKQPGNIPNPAMPFIIIQRKDTPTQ